MNNKNESLRSLMKQKLASKPQDTLSGKDKLKLLKQMKEASNKPPNQDQQAPTKKEVSLQSENNNQLKSIPTKTIPQPVQLPFDFFDNAPSAVISTQSNEISINSSTTTTANTTSASSFPTGFFDNPYEEKLVIDSISSSNVAPPTEMQSEAIEEVRAVDGDFEGFMQEIKTISQKIEDQRVANEEEQQEIIEEKEEEEEEENLLVNEEFVEKLRQTTYYTKLGLFYQKLEQATASTPSSSTAVTSSNDSTINIAQVEKEVQELELLLVQQEALTPSLQKSNLSNGNSGGDIIDQIYLSKVEKKRKHQQLIEAIEEDERQEEEKRRKRIKEIESSNKINDKEEDNADDDDEEEDDDDEEEEESRSFVYNPLDFISYPN